MKPAIVSPVMRSIEVADTGRSACCYRDTLGFEGREQPGAIEAVYGPAQVQFLTQVSAPESAILFFQTGDVAAMHAAILARGGTPPGLDKVNWIKMRMFEIRDPDGHVTVRPFDDVGAAVA